MRWWSGIACLALGACFFDHAGLPAGSTDGGDTPDVALGPDADGDAGNGPDARADAEVCVPECVAADTLFDCSSGAGMQRKCDLGCISGAVAHCAEMVPSNAFDRGWLVGADANLTVPAGETWVFDTDTGRISRCGGPADVRGAGVGVMSQINFQTLPPPPVGSAIGVFTINGLTVESGATVRGVGAAAMGLFAADTVDLVGTVTVTGGARACDAAAACLMTTGDRKCGGPGAGEGGLTIMPGTGGGGGIGGSGGDGTTIELGGGGGAFGGMGGTGGGLGGSGGFPYGSLEPLIGGSGGGGGGTDTTSIGGWGGGAGGAIQITALTSITITELGVSAPAGVWAGGAGGGYATSSAGGGGGGAGGGILVEAPTIQIEFGRIAANGGGGGGTPSGAGFPPATEGELGTFGTVAALGGSGGNVGGGGGALAINDGAPGNPIGVSGDAGSGGGGAAGRVRIKTADPARLITSTPQVSPAATTTTITVQ